MDPAKEFAPPSTFVFRWRKPFRNSVPWSLSNYPVTEYAQNPPTSPLYMNSSVNAKKKEKPKVKVKTNSKIKINFKGRGKEKNKVYGSKPVVVVSDSFDRTDSDHHHYHHNRNDAFPGDGGKRPSYGVDSFSDFSGKGMSGNVMSDSKFVEGDSQQLQRAGLALSTGFVESSSAHYSQEDFDTAPAVEAIMIDSSALTPAMESDSLDLLANNPLLSAIRRYSSEEVAKLLKILGYNEYGSLLIKHEVTGKKFLYSDEIDLHLAGVTYRPHRLKILGFINRVVKGEYDKRRYKGILERVQNATASFSPPPKSSKIPPAVRPGWEDTDPQPVVDVDKPEN